RPATDPRFIPSKNHAGCCRTSGEKDFDRRVRRGLPQRTRSKKTRSFHSGPPPIPASSPQGIMPADCRTSGEKDLDRRVRRGLPRRTRSKKGQIVSKRPATDAAFRKFGTSVTWQPLPRLSLSAYADKERAADTSFVPSPLVW